jgi:sugar/nucleoside kinase (ribokinase family)
VSAKVRRAGLFVGLSTLDIVYRVAAAPGRDEKVRATGQELAAGGPVANAAVTFAALGGEATLVTVLGRHLLAGQIAAELESRGVTVVDATPDRTEPPAVSSAYVVEATGERSLVSVNAAGADPPPPGELMAMAAGVPVVLLDGQHPRLARAAASAARSAGRLVILDGGSWKPALPDLLPLVDVAACSASLQVPGTGSVEESAAALRERYGVPLVAVTAGPDPVRWWLHGETGAVPVPRVQAQDTLGAGDAFHGALAWALAPASRRPATARPGVVLRERERLVGALEFAVGVAAVRCETAGPRRWLDDPRLRGLAAALSHP